MKSCQICNKNEWLTLPDPIKNQSVTTAGRIIHQPLGKSQCTNCGFLQRIRAEFLGFTDYYEEDYANYYDRPGTEEFHKKRYKTIIDWMGNSILKNFTFKTVLDVGCGQGWAMDAIKNKYPDIEITGIEPSHYNVKIAKSKGFDVMMGKIEDLPSEKKFDLIFSNNVIQHVNDARRFLKNLTERLNEQGVIIVTCPNGSKPNIELLWADQNYSFLSNHLLILGKELGFETLYWEESAESNSLPPAQLLVLTNNINYRNKLKNNESEAVKNINDIYSLRKTYLNSFSKINEYLLAEIGEHPNVFNLGASYWSSILAAYCPDYWKRVDACLIDDNFDDDFEFVGKKTQSTQSVDKLNSVLVLGINPSSHSLIKDKFNGWAKVISWDQFINY